MDGLRIILSEISQMKTNIILYHFYVESKNDTNELIYKAEIDSQTENKLIVTKGLGLTYTHCSVLCLVAWSCPTLCGPMDSSQPGSSVHGDSPGQNTGVGCYAFLQGIFLIQGLNLSLLHCGQTLYHLSQRSPQQEQRASLTLPRRGMYTCCPWR